MPAPAFELDAQTIGALAGGEAAIAKFIRALNFVSPEVHIHESGLSAEEVA
jgi:hypothetical protein